MLHLVARHGPVLLQGLGVVLLIAAAAVAAKRHRAIVMLLVASFLPLVSLVPTPALAHDSTMWVDYWAFPQSGSKWDGGNDQCTLGTSIQDHDSTTLAVWAYGPFGTWKGVEPCTAQRTLPQRWMATTARWWVNGDGNGGGTLCGWIDWWYSDRATSRWGLTIWGMAGCGGGYVSTDAWHYTTTNGFTDPSGNRGGGRYNLTHHNY